VAHVDINPENYVLMDGDDAIPRECLIDFGLASKTDHQGKLHNVFKLTGTLDYLAPEMFTSVRVTKAIDVWSFGVTILDVCMGKDLFSWGNDDDARKFWTDKATAKRFMRKKISRFSKFFQTKREKDKEEVAIDFLSQLLKIDPDERTTAEDALAHKFLADRVRG